MFGTIPSKMTSPAFLLVSNLMNQPVQVCVVSSLVSVTPAQAFIHRNYEHPSGSEVLAKRIKASNYGGSKHSVWQGVRASSAAPYYLEDFTCGEHRYACSLGPYVLLSVPTDNKEGLHIVVLWHSRNMYVLDSDGRTEQ